MLVADTVAIMQRLSLSGVVVVPGVVLMHAYRGRSLEEAVAGARKPLVASAWSEQDAKCATGLQRLHTHACMLASPRDSP